MSLYNATFYTSDLELLFSDRHYVELMLKAEIALAEAQSIHRLIPATACTNIKKTCENIDLFDIQKLKQEIFLGGNAAIPLVQQIIAAVKSEDSESSKFIHLGVTSQDIVDTATVLLIKEYIYWLETKFSSLTDSLTALTNTHKHTLMIGRTLMQHARPITFGLKTAYWLESISQLNHRLSTIKSDVLKIQLGGAVGASNQFINKQVRLSFSKLLGISDSIPWHTNRSSLVAWASYLGMINIQLGKIAKDISLLMQTEIAEVSEGMKTGKGGSSTMPHKQNPVTSSLIIANSARSPQLVATMYAVAAQEHERSAGLWHAEWDTLTDLMQITSGSIVHSISLLEDLQVNKTRMLQNLDLTYGLIFAEEISFALIASIGKEKANEILKTACRKAMDTKKHLKNILQTEYAAYILSIDIEKLFDPSQNTGSQLEIIDEILSNSMLNK